jgi:hypothetical protein
VTLDSTSLSLLGVASLLICVGAVHDRLVVGGVLGGDATQLIERASEDVALFA